MSCMYSHSHALGLAFGERVLDDASPQVQVIAQLVTATSLSLSNGHLSRIALDVCAEDERHGLIPSPLQHVIHQLSDSVHTCFRMASHCVRRPAASMKKDRPCKLPCPGFGGAPNLLNLPSPARPSAHSQALRLEAASSSTLHLCLHLLMRLCKKT
jgi:hypothetical protein